MVAKIVAAFEAQFVLGDLDHQGFTLHVRVGGVWLSIWVWT